MLQVGMIYNMMRKGEGEGEGEGEDAHKLHHITSYSQNQDGDRSMYILPIYINMLFDLIIQL